MLTDQKYELVPVDQLKPHPNNPNQGDVGALMELIQANGFQGALLVQKSTSWVLSGNHRLMAVRELGFKEVPVIWLDVDEGGGHKSLIAHNRAAQLATMDEVKLSQLLVHLAMEDDLSGTGYDGDDLDALLTKLELDEPDDEPEPEDEPQPTKDDGALLVYVLYMELSDGGDSAFDLMGVHTSVQNILDFLKAWEVQIGSEEDIEVTYPSPGVVAFHHSDLGEGWRAQSFRLGQHPQPERNEA